MRRTLEKLASERKNKEDDFAARLEGIRRKASDDQTSQGWPALGQALNNLSNILEHERQIPPPSKRAVLSTLGKGSRPAQDRRLFDQQLLVVLAEFKDLLLDNLEKIKNLTASMAGLFELHAALSEARDREWDALGSNHVGIIFKSLEWRVDKLAAEHEDVKLLMKKFLGLKEKLNELLAAIEEKKLPDPAVIGEVLRPLEDWRYVAFENRYRGAQEKIRDEQRNYLPYFTGEGKVLDLGCGRGEFLEMLRANGIDSYGVDLNQQMVDICLDKGLRCERGDLLEKLAELEDGALAGIFCSQVVEHLPPAHLRRLVDLAYFKLKAGAALIIETINPASLFALAEVFFLDLSHEKPIHPQTLRFLLETAGFENTEIKYSAPLEQERLEELPATDERADVLNRNIDRLNKILFAPLNYAAIGKKR